MMYTSTTTRAMRSLLARWLIRKTASTGARRIEEVAALIATDVGAVRSENQDRVVSARFWDESGRPYTCTAIADGMGGMKSGEDSAAFTLAGFLQVLWDGLAARLAPEEALSRASQSANRAVYAKHGGKGGATLSALLITYDERAYWLNVGDSRVYAGATGKLSQLSIDDTLAGQLSRPVVDEHSDSQLIQFIGVGEVLEPHVSAIESGNHEWYLLTSDGVHNMPAAVALMSRIVDHAVGAGAAAKRLVEVARWCGGRDNASAAVVLAHANRGMDRPYQAGCMEVWDPFGDLHVVVESFVIEEKPKLEYTRQGRSASRKNDQGASKGARGKAQALGIGASQPLPEITQSQPVLNDATSLDEASEPEELPQLQIDLPTKSEE
jgi:serine/threonine protein phosphatase PrpC